MMISERTSPSRLARVPGGVLSRVLTASSDLDTPRRISRISSSWWMTWAKWLRKYKATPGQVALAWLMAQGDDIIPIPGSTKITVSRFSYLPSVLLLTIL